MMKIIISIVASDWLWLPGGARWRDVQRGETWYLHAVPWLALLLLVARNFCCWFTGAVGAVLGVSGRTCIRPVGHAVLEAAFSRRRRPSAREEEQLAEEVGWHRHRVRKWLHRARNWKKPSTLTKFQESSWHLMVYTLSTTFGLAVLVNEPNLLNLSLCYSDYPSKAPSGPVMGYWCLQVSLYTSELVSCCVGMVPRKKDFVALLVHHCFTLVLLFICYVVNMVPIGLVIAVLHDVADVFLETAKLLVYVKCSKMANVIFCAFALVFIGTRLVVLPNWVLPSLTYDLPHFAGSHSYITKTAILFIIGLLGLHTYWLSLIGKVALQMVAKPDCKDSRSDSELSDSDT